MVDVKGGWWMWRKGGCGERMDVEGGWWMWRKGGCGGRAVDVKGGWWMWREGGRCEGRKGGCGGRVDVLGLLFLLTLVFVLELLWETHITLLNHASHASGYSPC